MLDSALSSSACATPRCLQLGIDHRYGRSSPEPEPVTADQPGVSGRQILFSLR